MVIAIYLKSSGFLFEGRLSSLPDGCEVTAMNLDGSFNDAIIRGGKVYFC